MLRRGLPVVRNSAVWGASGSPRWCRCRRFCRWRLRRRRGALRKHLGKAGLEPSPKWMRSACRDCERKWRAWKRLGRLSHVNVKQILPRRPYRIVHFVRLHKLAVSVQSSWHQTAVCKANPHWVLLQHLHVGAALSRANGPWRGICGVSLLLKQALQTFSIAPRLIARVAPHHTLLVSRPRLVSLPVRIEGHAPRPLTKMLLPFVDGQRKSPWLDPLPV